MKGKVIYIMKRTIESIGTFDMKEVDLRLSGQVEIFLSPDEIGGQVDKIVGDCLEQYGKQYPGIDLEEDVYFNFTLLYTLGVNDGEWQEYMIDVCIWQKSDEFMGKTSQYYSDIPLSLSVEEGNKVKQIIIDKVADMLFGSAGSKQAVA